MRRLRDIWKRSETLAVRFWFGLASIGFGIFMAFANPVLEIDSHEYIYMLLLAPRDVWGALFVLHGIALLYGVITARFSNILLLLEGVLGCALWAVSAVAMTLSQGSPGPAIAGGAISVWLLTRYPTHWEYENDS